MNKKILIGSIIAVVILVLVSFTGVVGYQTTKSSTIAITSPLFTVRSSRAIDEESKDLTCDYIGKGKTTLITIPKRDENVTLIQRAIEVIGKLDEEAYYHFREFVVDNLFKGDAVKELEIPYEPIEREIMGESIPKIPYGITSNNPILCAITGGVYAIFLVIFLIYLKITGFTTDPSECYTEYLPCL